MKAEQVNSEEKLLEELDEQEAESVVAVHGEEAKQHELAGQRALVSAVPR